jgi:hypothetical protein
MKLAATYCVVVGLLMLCQWLFFLAAGQVPEVTTAPVELAFHLTAELATAATLVAGGLAVLAERAWGRWVAVMALGMVSYSVIVSAGYFAQQGGWPLVAMFAVLLAGALASVRALVSPALSPDDARRPSCAGEGG